MIDRSRFGHKVSAYERPNLTYRCGRGGMWKKVCWQGPGVAGACGGEAECAPARIADRWECRRPKRAGGSCADGPLPDGSCALRHPPCAPRRNVRSMRAHVSLIAALALLVLLIIGVDPRQTSMVGSAAIDAGNLTSVHAGFTREQGCAACHTSHARDAGGWLLAAFRSNDPSGRCLDCHDFSGPANLAHNMPHPQRTDLPAVTCTSCHTEHRGANARIAQVADFVCANCHAKSFDNFVSNHPAFPAQYPYMQPGRIYFDHAKHIKEYFTDPKRTRGPDRDAKFAAEARTKCTACHSVENATREVKPRTYAQICAGCHNTQITGRELVLFEPEKITAAGSLLLGMERDADEDATRQSLGKLWAAMARDGAQALAGLGAAPAAERKPAAGPLLAGLGDASVRAAGSAWSGGRELAVTGKPDAAGWSTGENSEGNPSLFYRAAGHADPVMKAWIESLLRGLRDKDAGRRALAKEAMNDFLDSQTGPGACGKCHSAALRPPARGSVAGEGPAWGYAGSAARPLTRYLHAPHLGLVDPDAGCTTCHVLNAGAKYSKYFTTKASAPAVYESNFAGIRKETCVECHREGQVNSACQVCHAYHLPHRFNLGFRQKGMAQK